MKIDRLSGAKAISAKAVAIGMEHDVVIADCIWDLGDDCGHEYAHRLDLVTAAKTVRLYFPDLELTTSGNGPRNNRTEDRLRRAIAQLLTRSPSRTYSC
jgi:hypothetical protein